MKVIASLPELFIVLKYLLTAEVKSDTFLRQSLIQFNKKCTFNVRKTLTNQNQSYGCIDVIISKHSDFFNKNSSNKLSL